MKTQRDLFKKIIKLLKQKWHLPLITVMLAGGWGVKTSGLLLPGPVSSIHFQNRPIRGYVSHADFQTDCTHCHAPVHCITDDRCQDCHMDVSLQRDEGTGLHSLLPGTEKCQTCHPEHLGFEASITDLAYRNMDHGMLTGFSLDLHSENFDETPLDCGSCHSRERYGLEELDCITCHIEADHPTMSAHIEEYGSDCTACHDGRDRMMDFDHDVIYKLDGLHSEVACADCHLNQQYRETPSDCISCHTEPELHLGLFGQDCYRCHTAAAWVPASLLQHNFAMNHNPEEEGFQTCETCHAGTYTEYPCYTCHTVDEMEFAHIGEDVENLDDCLYCHPTGRGVARESTEIGGVFDFIASRIP